MQIVGILNCTADSFSDGNKYFSTNQAKKKLQSLFLDGADVVDIGAQATNYNAIMIPWDEEWKRIEPLLNLGFNNKISIDTFNYQTAERAIEKGVAFINDVNSGRDDNLVKLIADNPQVKYIAMLSTVVPADKQNRLTNFAQLLTEMKQMIARIINAGVSEKQLIIDPGIGFVSDAKLSYEILLNAQKLKSFGFPVMIGHSRKSFLENMINLAPEQRDIETLSISQYLKETGIDIIRVHNVNLHKRFFNIYNTIKMVA